MRTVGLMEEFALGAAVVVVAAKENVAAVEAVAARVTVRGMAAMISVVGPHWMVGLMMQTVGMDGMQANVSMTARRIQADNRSAS
jgi:anaerobic C4-dicarboxylate transporter